MVNILVVGARDCESFIDSVPRPESRSGPYPAPSTGFQSLRYSQ